MELHAKDIVTRHGAGKTPRVFARRHQIALVIGNCAIGMREGEVFAIVDAVEEACDIRTPCKTVNELDRVPAHVRNLVLNPRRVERRHALDMAGQYTQSRQALALGLTLVAPIEEQVHAEANPQKRHSVGYGRTQCVSLPRPLHRRHRIGESAHTGQHHAIGGQDVSGTVGDTRIVTRIGKATLHASQIALAVVDDGNRGGHYSTPLVEGTSLAMRGLMATAALMARAAALKAASRM